MKTHSEIWGTLSAISFICCLIMIGLGLNKMFIYDNGEYYPFEYHNAYVGGDAYNYIINGNYATGFFVLATMFALLFIGFIAVMYLERISVSKAKEVAPTEKAEELKGDSEAEEDNNKVEQTVESKEEGVG